MKKFLILATAFVAGAVVFVLITENSNRDLWEDVHPDFR